MAEKKVERIEHGPHDYLEVEALKAVTWNGKTYRVGETFIAKRYEMVPSITAGQVKAVATLPGYDPTNDPEEIVAGKPPVEKGGK